MFGGFNFDETALQDITATLVVGGWNGTEADLQGLFRMQHDATSLRLLWLTWRYGNRSKKFVEGIIAAGLCRGADISITNLAEAHTGPSITLTFPASVRLQAIQIQVKRGDEVYVVRKFEDDWRSARTFRLERRKLALSEA